MPIGHSPYGHRCQRESGNTHGTHELRHEIKKSALCSVYRQNANIRLHGRDWAAHEIQNQASTMFLTRSRPLLGRATHLLNAKNFYRARMFGRLIMQLRHADPEAERFRSWGCLQLNHGQYHDMCVLSQMRFTWTHVLLLKHKRAHSLTTTLHIYGTPFWAPSAQPLLECDHVCHTIPARLQRTDFPEARPFE